MTRARVLVVDDESMICDVIRMMLEEKHDVETASSGAEARKKIESGQTFDVILCDLMMGDLSGMELYKLLSDSNPQMAKRMVFMTGGAYTPESRQFVETTPARFIEKPLAWNAVEDAVWETIEKQGFAQSRRDAEGG